MADRAACRWRADTIRRAVRCLPLSVLLLIRPACAGDPVRILPLGDSITHGYYTGATVYNSYRKELAALLDAGGYETDFVGGLSDGDFGDNEHEGHDGYYAAHTSGTNNLLDHAASWVAASGADVILLHIGTNDILAHHADAGEVSLVLDAVYAANPNATVILALIINADPSLGISTDITTYNSNLNAMAELRAAAGEDLLVVDMENGAGLDYSSSDMIGIHPSPAGYDKMATNWYPAVTRAVLHQSGSTAPRIESVAVTNHTVILEVSHLAAGSTLRIESLQPPAYTNWIPLENLAVTGFHASWTGTAAATNRAALYRAGVSDF